MIMVAGLPIIEWQIRWLSRHGVKEFVVCVGYLKELVTGHVGNGGRLGATVEYAVEEEPLGTGGALLNAKGLLVGQSGFFMLNGDVLTNLDPARLRDGGAANALALVPLQSPYGVVEVDGTSKVTRFVEKPKIPDRWINAGVYHFTNEVFSYLPDRGNIEVTALPAMAREGKLRAAKYDDVFWHSIDSHKDIEEAAKEMKTGP
jgi:NDP-sugar pyrophosphorylase family protein